MKPHTALVIKATFAFDTCEQFTNLFQVPVSAFCTTESECEGHGISAVDPKDAEAVAFTACELADMVGMGAAPESELPEEALRRWAVEKVAELKRLVVAAESALEEEFDEFQDAAEKLKTAAQTYALGIRGWRAGQPLDPILDE